MTDLSRVVEHIRSGQCFFISSHQRPDGDAIGSAMAMAFALRALGKQPAVVMDAVPPHYLQPFPAVDQIRISRQVDDVSDGALIMECGSLARTGVAGLDRSPVVNIDHHVGNTRYGAINWVDESAAACSELVFTLVEALGVPLTADLATHIYLGLLTDTGRFHFSHITPRSFEIARRCVEAGADPQWIARTHYDSSTLGRVRLFGHVLHGMEMDATGRVALLTISADTLASTQASLDDSEGLINFPLSVKDVQAVAMFKPPHHAEPARRGPRGEGDGEWRVSMRSKGDVDVGAIARSFGGGGHKNAAGCTVYGELDPLRQQFFELLSKAVTAGESSGASKDAPLLR